MEEKYDRLRLNNFKNKEFENIKKQIEIIQETVVV